MLNLLWSDHHFAQKQGNPKNPKMVFILTVKSRKYRGLFEVQGQEQARQKMESNGLKNWAYAGPKWDGTRCPSEREILS